MVSPHIENKGIATLELAAKSEQINVPLPGLEGFAPKPIERIDDYRLLYFLVHHDKRENELRFELSEPIFDSQRKASWGKRIIMKPFSTNPASSLNLNAKNESPVIEIKKKQVV